MPARHRPKPKTIETVHRTYSFPTDTRKGMTLKRKEFEMTVSEFLTEAISNELPLLEERIEKLGLPKKTDQTWRPARLPMTDKLLAALKDASESTGIPASRLLLGSINRASRRKRVWPK